MERTTRSSSVRGASSRERSDRAPLPSPSASPARTWRTSGSDPSRRRTSTRAPLARLVPTLGDYRTKPRRNTGSASTQGPRPGPGRLASTGSAGGAAEAGEEAAGGAFAGLAAQVGELADEPALLLGEVDRHLDPQLDQQVAATPAPAVAAGHALLAEALDRPGLRARVDLDGELVAVEGLELHAPTQDGDGHRHRDPADQVVAAAAEYRVRGDRQLDPQVTGRPAELPGMAPAGQALAHAVLDPRRDVDRDRRFLGDHALAAALAARRTDLLAGALAELAGRGGDDLPEQ